MRATCWHGTRSVRVDEVPEPKILNARDAILRITRTAICGSDLHLYNGFVPTMRSGDVLGHEFMGEVVETGSHEELLSQMGLYYAMWRQQIGERKKSTTEPVLN